MPVPSCASTIAMSISKLFTTIAARRSGTSWPPPTNPAVRSARVDLAGLYTNDFASMK